MKGLEGVLARKFLTKVFLMIELVLRGERKNE